MGYIIDLLTYSTYSSTTATQLVAQRPSHRGLLNTSNLPTCTANRLVYSNSYPAREPSCIHVRIAVLLQYNNLSIPSGGADETCREKVFLFAQWQKVSLELLNLD